ncbi:MAG TPA: hypothetical protein VMN99_03875 [Anaerolineales bacterium]|nr:hypothetical protein [Anaerolineales bacterium]
MFSSSFWVADRAPVIPLFFKFLNKDPEAIVKAQLWFSILAWLVLAFSVALVLKHLVLKVVAFITILGFSLTQNIIIWDSLILSDSLALSLLALFLAACLWLMMDWNWYTVLVFGLLGSLLVLTRDSYAYLLLMADLTLWTLMLVTPHRARVALISGIVLMLFLASNLLATAGNRWYTPFLMTVGLRILPNSQYLDYFRAQGMPVSDALMERAGKALHADDLALLKDPALEEFRDWAQKNGRRVYIKFLWHFKAETLQNPLDDLVFVFNPDIYYYAATGFHPIITDPRLNEILYPTRYGILAVLVANLLAAVFLFPAFQYRRLFWVVPIMLILFSYPQAVLIWNADANDIARHSLYHNIELRLGLWMLVFFVFDFLFQDFKWSGLERVIHVT